MHELDINSTKFNDYNADAYSFYQKYGYVCIKDFLTPTEIESTVDNWKDLTNSYSKELGVDIHKYLNVISQWRDLWKEKPFFRKLLDDKLSSVAAWSMNLDGSRLLHDHFIRKVDNSANGLIPWHQDSMFWPVDRTGLSTWFSSHDVGLEGCLQVIRGSHLWESSPPVDFMSEEQSMSGFESTYLPVSAGDLIVLNSKTWHRSQPVENQAERLAHIALWLPPNTRYAPEKAEWHPLNEQITVASGELLNLDEFPVYGNPTKNYGSSQENGHSGVREVKGMFNARSEIEKQVQAITGLELTLGEMLGSIDTRDAIANEMMAVSNRDSKYCSDVVEAVWISSSAYEKHRSRNVFNSAYAEWKELFYGK